MPWLSHATAFDSIVDKAGSSQSFQMNSHGIAAGLDFPGELGCRLRPATKRPQQSPPRISEQSLHRVISSHKKRSKLMF
jgi:hypothetical protein